MKTVNFIFIRHGESCQQVAYDNARQNDYKRLYWLFSDPTLSDKGEIQSINAGKEYVEKFKNEFNIDSFDIIGSSPMLRTIETAYYMTKEYNPDNIYVYPFLRECRECNDKDNAEKLNKIWPMKKISEQKDYLKSKNIENIDFKYVENNKDRESPGNIEKFLEWFHKNVNIEKDNTNVLIITHSHVLRFFRISAENNAGVYLKTVIDKGSIVYTKNDIKSIWPKYLQKKFKCPQTRCKEICETE